MMNGGNRHLSRSTIIAGASVLLFASSMPARAAPEWYSMGLDGRAVHCILAVGGDQIMVGTDSGISLFAMEKWWHIPLLPVFALVRISSSAAVVAAAGKGSWSDGIYIGLPVINGPPFYSFRIGAGCWMPRPTALAARKEGNGTGTATVVYAGGGNTVAKCDVVHPAGNKGYDSLGPLRSIKAPSEPFGEKSPYCSAIHVFSDDDQLYAGGYDRGRQGGPGDLFFYSPASDSLVPAAPFSVRTTALTEGRFFAGKYPVLAVARADTGLYLYSPIPKNPWLLCPGPTKSPILALCIRSGGTAESDMLYAGCSEGVFVRAATVWTKIGDLKATPTCLATLGRDGDLLAGTLSGLYRYGEPPVTSIPVPNPKAASLPGKRSPRVVPPGSREARAVGAVFDIRGRQLNKAARSLAQGVIIVK